MIDTWDIVETSGVIGQYGIVVKMISSTDLHMIYCV